MYNHCLKRIFDFTLALIGLITLGWLLLLIALALYIANGFSTPFFLQPRPGRNGKIFNIIKFKTMFDAYDENGIPLPDQQRLTKVGRLVRKLSVDELPQLINVLIGDMALIGPRPLHPIYLYFYNEREMHRHDVRPGITGWAQVNGRKSITWAQKFEYDLYYVENVSFKLDIRILFLTFYKVIKRENVGVETSGTVNFFDVRIKEWENEGRQDLIDAAQAKRKEYLKREIERRNRK